MLLNRSLTGRQVSIAEILIILLFSFFPALMDYPFRVNIFLTYEGAYRMYLGQVPFKDFGLPLGYGFWIIPWLFFNIFGPKMYSLILAQCFINLVSLFTFRAILKLFNVGPVERLLSLLVFCLSFMLVNFWPWYNHTVFVFELIGLYFLLAYILKTEKIYNLIIGAFFIALCFMTKQDAGGLGLMFAGVLIVVHALLTRSFKPVLYFAAAYIGFMALMILPFLSYEFSYWFNLGKPPHFSRINLYDFITTIFEESLWIKFYLIAVPLIVLARFKSFQEFVTNKQYLFFSLFTFGIMGQALIIQVTSFSPVTTSYYYHSFGFAFLVYHVGLLLTFEKVGVAVLSVLLVLFWRSENYWKYSMRFLSKFLPASFSPPPAGVVSKNTWAKEGVDTVVHEPVIWQPTKYNSLKKIKLPSKTIEGLERIESLDVVKNNPSLKVLNMSNLTFLARELPYTPLSGTNFPLWYHKGVAFFDRETQMICDNIQQGEYDLVLFEVMPDVDSFFPFDVRECLQQHYHLTDSFLAPTGYQTDFVEVYTRR